MSLTSGYPFALHYYANGEDGQSDECFVWEINVPVSNFAPVELTYSVKLTNPQSADGTYGHFDADGSEHFDSLLTNLNATLYPVDSNGDQGMPEYFAKPTVSYTNTTPGGGGGGDDDDDDDDGGPNIPDEKTPTTPDPPGRAGFSGGPGVIETGGGMGDRGPAERPFVPCLSHDGSKEEPLWRSKQTPLKCGGLPRPLAA